MKTLKKMLLIMGLFFLMTGFATNVFAGAAWYTANINTIGFGTNGVIYFNLTDTADPAAFQGKWFTPRADEINKILAMALTAFSLPTTIYVNVDLAEPVSRPTINGIHLRTQ